MTEKQSHPEILNRLSISPAELHEAGILPLSRGAIYCACNSGEIECTRIGKRIVIPTAPRRRMLGIAAA
jgi:hypothetical protein